MAVIDADNLVVGRLASHVAKRLLAGEEIHIVNAENAVITGGRDAIMKRYNFKRDVGTRRKGPFMPRMPHRIVKRTVRGMLPYQSGNGRQAFRRLRVHIGVPDELANMETESVEGAKNHALRKMTVGDIARNLGAKY